jgi:hypothetical protein
LDLKLQIFQRGIMPTVLSAFTVLTPIHINNDGADASRRVIVLRIPIRFLSGAARLAIKRLQRTAVPASKLACPSAADPQLR